MLLSRIYKENRTKSSHAITVRIMGYCVLATKVQFLVCVASKDGLFNGETHCHAVTQYHKVMLDKNLITYGRDDKYLNT